MTPPSSSDELEADASATGGSGPVDVLMPQFSEGTDEATVLEWLKQSADRIEPGDALADIETDKAVTVYAAEAAGFLEPLVSAGETVPVGARIARLWASWPPPSSSPASGSSQGAAPTRSGDGDGRALDRDEGASAAAHGSSGQAVEASPRARRAMKTFGLDPGSIVGSGPGGRILEKDVDLVVAQGDHPHPPELRSSADVATEATDRLKGSVRRVAPSQVERVMARRMTASKDAIPQFAISLDVDAEPAFALRDSLRTGTGPTPSITDIVVKACGMALRANERLNASYRGDALYLYSRVNVGVAVAVDTGLYVPTVFDVDRKSLDEVAKATSEFASRLRGGRPLSPDEVDGATFTVSNLGMYGMDRIFPIINLPQVAILGVGRAIARPVVSEAAALEARRVMTLTLIGDHRAMSGVEAAGFLNTLQAALDAPFDMEPRH